jgi:hypothetical protein
MLRKAIWAVVLGLTANIFALLSVGYADDEGEPRSAPMVRLC